MTRLISKAEGWEVAYQAFTSVNFAAFDFNTVKQSMLEYIKLYFPESFNDFIESSEFIAIIEIFAYLAEILAYRYDLNANENFISNAQRRESVLRLAQFISYNPSRNLPARGLVKITSVSTTERTIDANGVDITNQSIRWNDNTNLNWKNQFLQIMNKVLQQPYGTVAADSRFQIEDVLFEIYSLGWIPPNPCIFKYSAATSGGVQVPMELVPVAYDKQQGIIEKRPENDVPFFLLYGSDGQGDSSNLTGFFCYTKQGTLQKTTAVFDGVTPNQFFDVPSQNINDTDVWLNQINPETGEIVNTTDILLQHPSPSVRSGEWAPVPSVYQQNVIFNTLNYTKNKYQVQTLANDAIRLVFGDDEFANIPGGTFNIWTRASANQDLVVPQVSVIDIPLQFSYLDINNRVQTFSFTVTLTNSLLNASATETTENVRLNAPGVYATQDRMVSAQDYNTYLLQDPSILKLRAVNRTFVGESRFISWHDPSGNYENVKIFGDDLILYIQNGQVTSSAVASTYPVLINTFIQPLLSSADVFLYLTSNGIPEAEIRRVFNQTEIDSITVALTPPPSPSVANLYFNKVNYQWYACKSYQTPNDIEPGYVYPRDYLPDPVITVNQTSIFNNAYTITRLTTEYIMQSDTTQFWNTNEGQRVINYSTLNSDYDTITILQANVAADRTNLMTQNWQFNVLYQTLVDPDLPDSGLPDIHRVSVIPVDNNQDRLPDNVNLVEIINPRLKEDTSGLFVNTTTLTPLGLVVYEYTLPTGMYGIVNPSVVGIWTEDLRITVSEPTLVNYTTVLYNDAAQVSPTLGPLFNRVRLTVSNPSPTTPVTVSTTVDFIEHVYFNRFTLTTPWVYIPSTYTNLLEYVNYNLTRNAELAACTNGDPNLQEQCEQQFPPLWKRAVGRCCFNFAWFHFTPYYHLTDPAVTNIIDMFIITKGYYNSVRSWLSSTTLPEPTAPTPVDLRNSYNYLLANKMISDTVVLHPGKFRLLFGPRAIPELRAVLKIIRADKPTLTDTQIRASVVNVVRNFFDIQYWNFGETFFFTELAAAIHIALQTEIKSVVLVPTFETNQFGDLFELQCREDEIFQPDISVDQVEIVASYNEINLRLNG